MRRSLKAALLSGLVFPGTGHLYLGRHVRGILLVAAAAALLYYIVSVAVDIAYGVVGTIESGETPLDAVSISQMVSSRSQEHEGAMNLASYALLAVWVVGIADSYREGRAQEKAGERNAGVRRARR